MVLYREFSGTRRPQVDRIDSDLVALMCESATYAAELLVSDGIPTSVDIIHGSPQESRRATEAAQEYFG